MNILHQLFVKLLLVKTEQDVIVLSISSLGPSDNDQHSPVKRREPLPSSSSRLKYLKHISVKSKHPEGNISLNLFLTYDVTRIENKASQSLQSEH